VDDVVGAIVFLGTIAVLFASVVIAARRFVRKRRKEGLWNEQGPIDPSLPPPDFLQVYPRPWGIQRPTIETELEEENPFLYPVEKKHHSESNE
jgi:hypothetical protein